MTGQCGSTYKPLCGAQGLGTDSKSPRNLLRKQTVIRALVAIACASSCLREVQASFVHIGVTHSAPELPLTERSFGCEPAMFTGQDQTMTNVTMVLLEAGKDDTDSKACAAPTGLSADEAKAKYSGKAVMVKRGTCSFETKWLVLRELGASGMIVVQNRQGAQPVTMIIGDDSQNSQYDNWRVEPNGVGIPVCMTYFDQWERFVGRSHIRISFKNLRKYKQADEYLPTNDITGILVSQLSGAPQYVPAAQATFNPQMLNWTRAQGVVIQWDPLCLAHPSTDQCSQCYKLDSKVKDAALVRGKIAIVRLDPQEWYCFQWMWEIVMHVQLVGAQGMVFVNYFDELFTYIPHQVPFNITIPFVNVMYTYGTALIERVQTGQPVELTFPPLKYTDPTCDSTYAVCIPSGPPVEFSVPIAFEPTGVLVIAASGESRFLEAGQATFNPISAHSLSDSSGAFAINASIVEAEFIAACAAVPDRSQNESNPCSPCYNDLDAAIVNGPALAGKVVLVPASDVRCVGGYKDIVQVVSRKLAVGVLIASSSDRIFTMTSETSYTSSIPVFSIKSSDAAWILERIEASGALRARVGTQAQGHWQVPAVEESVRRVVAGVTDVARVVAGGAARAMKRAKGLRAATTSVKGVSALLPRLEQMCEVVDEGRVCYAKAAPYEVISGIATEWCPIKQAKPGQLQVLEPPSMRQQLTAGGAAFNPPTWSGRQAKVVMARWGACAAVDECVECDENMCRDLRNRDDMRGRVMLHWQVDAVCLSAAEAAKCAEEAGAVAMIFMSSNSMIVTLPPSSLCLPRSWPAFSIATFNVPSSSKAAAAWREHCQCQGAAQGDQTRCVAALSREPVVMLQLPTVDSGSPLPTMTTGSGRPVLQDQRDVPGAKAPRRFPAWAIALIVGIFVLLNLAFFVYHVRKMRLRRRAYILSALDQGTQFQFGDVLQGVEMYAPASSTSREGGEPTAPSLSGDTPRSQTAAIEEELMGGLGGRRTTGRIMSAVPARFQPAAQGGAQWESRTPLRGILEHKSEGQKQKVSSGTDAAAPSAADLVEAGAPAAAANKKIELPSIGAAFPERRSPEASAPEQCSAAPRAGPVCEQLTTGAAGGSGRPAASSDRRAVGESSRFGEGVDGGGSESENSADGGSRRRRQGDSQGSASAREIDV